MLLTKREDQLLRAFQEYGKLSLNQISELLKVSRRTVYRTLADLTEALNARNISIIKEDGRYLLVGDLANLASLTITSLAGFSQEERLQLMTYKLLTQTSPVTNEQLQEQFEVSNVTIIQDIALIEERLADFEIFLQRQNGYQLADSSRDLRRFLAILLTNSISIADFWAGHYGQFSDLASSHLDLAKEVFQSHQEELVELDSRLSQFFIVLLSLSGFGQTPTSNANVSRVALDVSQKIYGDFSQATSSFYNIQEILYFASVLDELVVKRQETPLFNEKFDSEFFYKIANLIDKVSLYTKINFAKDPVLFRFLFNHIRLNLAVPLVFPAYSQASVSYLAAHRNEHLHNVVSLLVQEMFPKYLQNQTEYELITLHFASSLRRSPHIYPIKILLLTDERPLARELLVTRIRTIAPFVDKVRVKPISQFKDQDKQAYHAILSTKPQADREIYQISVYPDAKETLSLQDFLQEVQANQTVILTDEDDSLSHYDLATYFEASQDLLNNFTYQTLDNPADFKLTVPEIMADLDVVTDAPYLAQKLLSRFEVSPLAIPETNLALLHTQSSKVTKSCFAIYDLKQSVTALSMNKEEETISRILVMLTRLDEKEEVRELMTAISQSLIENHLYTEIYKTGNRQIIYQLLNQIFTEKIKKLET